MTDLERMYIEHECLKLVHGYCVHYDSEDNAAFVDLWADDAVWVGSAGELTGIAAIRESMASRKRKGIQRHVSANALVRVIDADRAEGVSYIVFYLDLDGEKGKTGKSAAPRLVGRYFDTYARTARGWKIATRRMDTDLSI